TPPTPTPTNAACVQYRSGAITYNQPQFPAPNYFAQGAACTASGGSQYNNSYEFYIDTTSEVVVTGQTCSPVQLTVYQAPGGAPMPAFNPNNCTNAVASVSGLNLKVTLAAGYYYLVVSAPVQYLNPGYYFNVTSSPILMRSDTISASNRTFTQP